MARSPDPLIVELARRRRVLGIRVDDIAAATHHNRKTIYGWENGTRTPSITGLRAYAEQLGVHLSAELVPPHPQGYPQPAYEAVRDERFAPVRVRGEARSA